MTLGLPPRAGFLLRPGPRPSSGLVPRPGRVFGSAGGRTSGTLVRSGLRVRSGLLVTPGTRLLLGRVVLPALSVDRVAWPGSVGVVRSTLGRDGTLPRKVGARLLVGVRVTDGLGVLLGVAGNLSTARLGELKLLDLSAGL